MNEKVKRLAQAITRIYLKPFHAMTKKLDKDYDRLLFAEACKIYEKSDDFFYSYKIRPIRADQIAFVNINTCSEINSCAIVMQGPLMQENDFTLETIKLYRKFYPEIIIIVSTWDDEDIEIIKQMKSLKVEVVLTKKPNSSGRLNVNYQIINSKAGVDKAVELGSKYICKTRTDQRFYKRDFFSFMIGLIKLYPCGELENIQKGRIITLPMEYGNIFYPYLISDFLYFGFAEDIQNIFSIPLDKREHGEFARGITRKEVAAGELASEIYIIKEFIKYTGGEPKDDIKSYWDYVRNGLICLDREMVGFYWPKYEARYTEHLRNGLYCKNEDDLKLPFYNFDYINWVNLYLGNIKYRREFEKFSEYHIT